MSSLATSVDEDERISMPALGRSQTICRYYLRGICRFGELCRFSHDLIEGPPSTELPIQTGSTSVDGKPGRNRRNWANASIFVPGQKSYVAQSQFNDDSGNALVKNGYSYAVIAGGPSANSVDIKRNERGSLEKICSYESPCPYGIYCPYRIHMELCRMCDQYCLHPTDQAQRKKHNRECLQQHEQAMELSFAIARSKDKTCGICFDTIMEKAGREKRFGILPNCNHIFCIECIRKWRQAKQFEHKITRACPECRVCSDFVCPNTFWVETKEDKDKLLTNYRAALGAKDCKYFKKGEGKCPFGNKCFYKHALPNGEIVDVGLPKSRQQMDESVLERYFWINADNINFFNSLYRAFWTHTSSESSNSSDDE